MHPTLPLMHLDNVKISAVDTNLPVSPRVSESFGERVSVNFQPCDLRNKIRLLLISIASAVTQPFAVFLMEEIFFPAKTNFSLCNLSIRSLNKYNGGLGELLV